MGRLAFVLGLSSLLGTLCFQFPDWFTTAEFRATYPVEALRWALVAAVWMSLTLSALTFVRRKRRGWGAAGLILSALAIWVGGWELQTGHGGTNAVSLGVDWMLLDLLGSVVLFVAIEKLVPKYREQPVLRPGWRLDLAFFTLNHLIVSVLLIASNGFAPTVFGWAVNGTVQGWVTSLPLWGQFLLLVAAADLVQYWVHRLFHEVPWLWRFHAVHHSTEHMDWLAGSRTHPVQVLVDRTLVMVPLYLLGPSVDALNAYVVFIGLHAVFIHANVGLHFGPLKALVVTPQFHHWHHSSEDPAIDTNYAVHLPVYDWLFGTLHLPGSLWPAHYGTVKKLPDSFVGQLAYPFLPEGEEPGSEPPSAG